MGHVPPTLPTTSSRVSIAPISRSRPTRRLTSAVTPAVSHHARPLSRPFLLPPRDSSGAAEALDGLDGAYWADQLIKHAKPAGDALQVGGRPCVLESCPPMAHL